MTIYLIIKIIIKRKANIRRNNLPITNEVIVFVPNNRNIRDVRSVVLNKRKIDNTNMLNLRKIDFYDPNYISLYYIFLFFTVIKASITR